MGGIVEEDIREGKIEEGILFVLTKKHKNIYINSTVLPAVALLNLYEKLKHFRGFFATKLEIFADFL